MPPRLRAALPLVIAMALAAPDRSHADAIIVTRAMLATSIAEIFVEEGSLRLELEIGVPDVAAFQNLLPDAVHEDLGHASEPLARRLPRFFRSDFVIRAEGGAPLSGRLLEIGPRRRVRRDEISGETLLSDAGEGEVVVFAVLEYALPERPKSLELSFSGGPDGVSKASVGFVLYHLGVAVNDFRYLGPQVILDLDWEDPWYSRFRSRSLRRRYDAPLNAFLYVEPYEVRSEIIARPLDLQQWIDLGLEGRRTIPVDMQAELKRKVAEFLAAHSPVTIDGEPVRPSLDRIHFLRRTLRSSAVIDPPEELDVHSAMLGAIYVFPTDGLPQEVTLTWDLFAPRIQRVPATASDEAGPLPYLLQPDDRVLRWQNFLKRPTLPTLVEVERPPRLPLRVLAAFGWLCGAAFALVVAWQALAALRGGRPSRRGVGAALVLLGAAALGLAGARSAAVDDERATEILTALLHNVYRAFDFRDESVSYDVLERSVAGDLLPRIYLEMRRGLELASQGGARVKVKEIELVNVAAETLDGGPGFLARCTWNVKGSVGHWGHVHQRTNRYQAELTVQPLAGHWKITELDLLHEERITPGEGPPS